MSLFRELGLEGRGNVLRACKDSISSSSSVDTESIEACSMETVAMVIYDNNKYDG
jgi:hypothetical protein